MPLRLRRLLPLLPLAALIAAAWAIHGFLSEHDYAALSASIDAVSWPAIGAALGLTAASFAVLVLYDALGIRYAGAHTGWRLVLRAAPIAYAFSNAIGISMLTSGALRLRLYRAAMPVGAIAKLTVFCKIGRASCRERV